MSTYEIPIVVTNAKEVSAKLDAAMARIEAYATRVFRGAAVSFFHKVVYETPQWSGNAVASWNFSVGSPDFSQDHSMLTAYRETEEASQGVPLYVLHDTPGIFRAIERNRGKDSDVSLDSEVYVTNAAEDFYGDSYIEWLEENPNGYLRPESEGGGMVRKAKDDFRQRYNPISPVDARRLAQLRIERFSP
jgi:hypothetical protein